MDITLTIDVPVEVRERAKARADLEGTTLADVLRQRLEEYAAGLDELGEAEDARITDEHMGRLARGEEGWASLAHEMPGDEDASWDMFFQLIDECGMDTGISDLADQHDHYLYGKPKHQ